MNKHMKLIFAALFIVIIVLAAAITRFYSHTDKNVYEGGAQSAIAKKLEVNENGDILFQDSKGMYGVADSSERVIVSPEWESLILTDSAYMIAEKHIHGDLLRGCIDYEGNVTVPLVYDSIEKNVAGGLTFYVAVSHNDGSCVIYNRDFVPCFTRSWDKCEFSENEVTLFTDKGSYLYIVNSNGFIMKKAVLQGSALSNDFRPVITSKLLLSNLTVPMLEKMTEVTGKYLEYAFTGSEQYLENVKTDENSVFTPLFPDEERIKSKKLTKISDIYLYSTRSDDTIPHFAVSVTVDANIIYVDDNNKNARMSDSYTAVIAFSGGSVGELTAVSGTFKEAVPEYPAPEPEHPAIGERMDEENGYTAGSESTTMPQTTSEDAVMPTTENNYQ